MSLVPESKHWHRLWSVRLGIAAAVFAWLEMALPAWEGIIPDGAFGILAAIAATGAPLARMIKQSLPDE